MSKAGLAKRLQRNDNSSHYYSLLQYWLMIVCVCKAVSDRQIRASIAEGVETFDDLQVELGVAICCGKCEKTVRDVMAQCGVCETHCGGDRSDIGHLDVVTFYDRKAA
jgi:bacterioferritin-associated ferredoxin